LDKFKAYTLQRQGHVRLDIARADDSVRIQVRTSEMHAHTNALAQPVCPLGCGRDAVDQWLPRPRGASSNPMIATKCARAYTPAATVGYASVRPSSLELRALDVLDELFGHGLGQR
jgi:hypothetical protein